ncbi:MAG: replication protein RepA [Alphaproteobacteria bacterium]|nr:replication protein RepA [Alphaproteobacteria bacterium]
MTDEPTNQPQHIAAIISGLPTPTIQTPQAQHHYSRAKQTEALVSIGLDPSADMGFMARMLTLCSLPRTDPGNRLQYKRENGPYKLVMIAGGDNKLPFGNIPRLLLAWLCTEAVRTQDRKLYLGNSLSSFMEQLGMYSNSGGKRGDRTRLKNQIDRLFNCHIDLIYEDAHHKESTGGRLAPKSYLWWDYRNPEQTDLFQSWVLLGEELFQEITARPIPIDTRILKEMKRSSLGLDLYMWLSYKTFSLYSTGKPPERLTWQRLYRQFGPHPENAQNKDIVNDFRKEALREIAKLKACWPSLNLATPKGCLEIRACKPSIDPSTTGRLKLPV